MRTRSKLAFSLIELVVIIVVIAILAGIATVGYQQTTSRSKREVVRSSAAAFGRAYSATLAWPDHAPEAEMVAQVSSEADMSKVSIGYAPGSGEVQFSRAGYRACLILPAQAQDDLVVNDGGCVGSIPVPRTVTAATASESSATVGWVIDSSELSLVDSFIVSVHGADGTSAPSGVTGPTSREVTVGDATIQGVGEWDGSYEFTDLSAGETYTFSVQAKSSVGTGNPSPTSAPLALYGAADAPTNLAATAGNAQIAYTWTPLTSTAAQPIAGYRIYVNGGSGAVLGCQILGASSTGCTATGLVNGTEYSANVVAYYSSTEGASSNTATATPFSVADAPANFSATAGNTQISYTWTALTSTAAKPVSGYRVYVNSGSGPVLGCQVAGAASTTCDVTGLTNGTSYSANVVAYFGSTEGSASGTATATPWGAADAPTNLAATAGNTQISYTWTALTSTAAKPISGYRVYVNSGSGAVLGCQVAGASSTSCTSTGLTNGTSYSANVVAYYSGTEGASSNTATATPFGAADAPTNLAATAGNTQISYTWTALTSTAAKPISGYRVYVNSGSGAVLGCQVAGASSTSCTSTGLTNGTEYSANVVAYYSATEGASSNTATATPYGAASAASSLAATAGDSQITYNWAALTSTPAQPISGYRVYVNSGSGAVLGCQVAGASSTTCTTTGLTNGTEYVGQVVAYYQSVEGVASTSATATPWGSADAPSNFLAAAGDTQISYTWTALSSTAAKPISGYRVYVNSGTGAVLGCQVAGASSTGCTSTGLTNGTSYSANVVAYYSATEGVSSNTATATPWGAADAPTNFTATAGNTQITYTWTALSSTVAKPVSGYRVYVNGGSGAVLGCQVAGASSTTCTATGLTNGTSYSANVVAYYSSTEGASSNTATATPWGAADAPTNLAATAGNAQITYTWTALTSTAAKPVAGYRVYVNSGTGAVLGCQVAGASSTTCTATGLTNGTQYAANVVAYSSGVEGTASASVNATPLTTTDVPTSVSATSGANAQSVVTWTAPASNGGSAITGYTVRYSSNSGSTWTTAVSNSGSTSTTATITGLTNGTSYVFAVAAINGAGTSGWSATSATATPYTTTATPSAPTISDVAATTLTVGWSYPIDNGGATATSMSIQRSTNLTTWTTLPNFAGTSASMSGLTRNTTYYYRVAANNAAGMSSYSAATSVTTLANTTTVYISDWSHTWVAWYWSNAGASNYQVWYNGVYQGVTGATSWSVSGRSSNTDHSLYVVPLNSAGVASAASNTVTQRTLSQGGSEPFGFQDSVYPGSTPVNQPMTASGWVIDPENWRPISVHVYAYGTVYSPAGTWAIATTANLNRPDIAAAYPGYGPYHGYSGTVTAGGNGAYNVCSYAINTYGAGGNTLLGCQGSYGR